MAELLLLSSLLLSFIASSLTAPIFPPVFDVEGRELKRGEAYYLLSGGNILLPVGICREEENVVQCPFIKGDPRGLPIIFTAVNNYGGGGGEKMADALVRENTYYNIFFISLDLFTEETYWYLKDGHLPNQLFVAEGPQYIAMPFAIRKVGLGYKLIYCVPIPIPRIPICYPLGFNMDNGYNRLGIGLGVRAALFSFKKNATCPIGQLCS